MPPRSVAAAAIARHLHGTLQFNSISDTATLGGRRMRRTTYDRKFLGAIDAAVAEIDWNRVLLEASGIHDEEGHAEDGQIAFHSNLIGVLEDGEVVYGSVCAICIASALGPRR